eukprot:6204582-Pleurochrysis_carterae.AAC.1
MLPVASDPNEKTTRCLVCASGERVDERQAGGALKGGWGWRAGLHSSATPKHGLFYVARLDCMYLRVYALERGESPHVCVQARDHYVPARMGAGCKKMLPCCAKR